MYVTMSVIGRNWHDCLNLSNGISMSGINVKQVNGINTVSDEEIDNVCILREMIQLKEDGLCDIFNIGDVDFIIND